MKCITIRQPWAWAIIAGLKRIENRSWTTKHRGPLLIHAGSSRAEFKDPSLAELMPTMPPAGSLSYGAIIGMVDLVDVVPLAEAADDPFASGPWCWVLRNPRAIGPIPLAGKLQLFEVPLDFAGLGEADRETLRGRPANSRP